MREYRHVFQLSSRWQVLPRLVRPSPSMTSDDNTCHPPKGHNSCSLLLRLSATNDRHTTGIAPHATPETRRICIPPESQEVAAIDGSCQTTSSGEPHAPTPAASKCRPVGWAPSRCARCCALGHRGTRRGPASRCRSGPCGRGPCREEVGNVWSQQGAKIAARNPSSTPRNALDHTSELDRDVHVGWQSRATLGMGLHRRGVLEGNRQVRKRATREKGSRGPENSHGGSRRN